MSYRPILFAGPMVRAILDGRKTQTRRVLKPQPPAGWHLVGLYAPGLTAVFDSDDPPGPPDWTLRLPYTIGDRLWVREAWRTVTAYEGLSPSEMGGEEPIRYEADGIWETRGWCCDGPGGRHRQGMHMPRWASRLTLTVTDVRVQRLQEISDEDAKAEGVEHDQDRARGRVIGWRDYLIRGGKCGTATGSFRTLWDSLNAKRAPWESNPWVVAYTFTVARGNIDAGGNGVE